MTETPRTAGEVTSGASVGRWRAVLPPVQWFSTYQPQWLAHDAIAGVTLADYGIYCYLVGGLLYALFGASRQLAIGPTSAISMVVGLRVARMANGDSARWASIAALTALLIAAMCLLACLLPSYAESVSAARALAQTNGYEIVALAKRMRSRIAPPDWVVEMTGETK